MTISDFVLKTKIPQQLFFADRESEVVLSSGDIIVSDIFDFTRLGNNPIMILRDKTKIQIADLNIKFLKPNKLNFIQCDTQQQVLIQNLSLKGLDIFMNATKMSFVNIENSNISTNGISVISDQSSCLDINNSIFDNDDFKFLIKDSALLSLRNSTVNNGSFLFAGKYSQTKVFKSNFKLKNNAVSMVECACVSDNLSKWDISSSKLKRYAFTLIDCAEIHTDKSKFVLDEQMFYSKGKTKINLSNSKIINKNNNKPLINIKDNTLINICNTIIKTQFLLKLEDNTNMYIDKSYFYVKNTAAKLINNSKLFIKNTLIKKDKNNSGVNLAFKIFHNSKLNLSKTAVEGFENGIMYDNNLKNIVISADTEINCVNRFYRRNIDKYINIEESIVPLKTLYKFQIFVLETRSVFLIKHIYNIIYRIATKIFPGVVNKKYVKTVYLRRGMLNDWIAGSSDIDYLTVIKDCNPYAEMQAVSEINKHYKNLRKIFPFYGENLIMKNTDLDFYMKYGGIRTESLSKSRLLYGSQNRSIQNISSFEDKKHKIDIVSEILNSYVLFSNNYFCDNDIVSDICFSKAAIDILKYNDYFDTNIKPVDSRTEFLKKYLKENGTHDKKILINLLYVLKNNAVLSNDMRSLVFDFVFLKLDQLSKKFNEFAMKNANVKTIFKKRQTTITNKQLNNVIDLLQNEINSLIFDSPGLCYVAINNLKNGENIRYSQRINNIYAHVKSIHNMLYTPLLFFTENMFQTMLFAEFQNSPFNYCKLRNISDRYFQRTWYLSQDTKYYYHDGSILKFMALETLSGLSFHINNIDVSKGFVLVRNALFELFVGILQLKIYIKNGIIKNNYSSDFIINKYKDIYGNPEFDLALNTFADDCNLSDLDKITKIIVYIKKIKDELIEEYLYEQR